MEPVKVDTSILVDIVRMRMPFGKYKGTLICELPVYYLEWMYRKGFPPGKLGMMLSTVYEIKINGLNKLLDQVKKTVNNQAPNKY
jgi:uncharacterized protein (DUF3820 family)